MAGLLAYFTMRMTAVLKRAVISYCIMALGALIAVSGIGYALNACYMALMFRYGPIAASLAIAGGLLVASACCIGAARIVNRRRRITANREQPAAQYAHLPLAHRANPGLLALGAGAATAAIVVAAVGLIRRKSATIADASDRAHPR